MVVQPLTNDCIFYFNVIRISFFGPKVRCVFFSALLSRTICAFIDPLPLKMLNIYICVCVCVHVQAQMHACVHI